MTSHLTGLAFTVYLPSTQKCRCYANMGTNIVKIKTMHDIIWRVSLIRTARLIASKNNDNRRTANAEVNARTRY
jgi:hypothetical protein